MDIKLLKNTIRQLLAPEKGLLAMDESTASCNKRFAPLNIPQTEEFRQKYREMIITTPGLETYISGAILVEETLFQNASGGTAFTQMLNEKGIIPGIKVDRGTVLMPGSPGEKLTEGLDDLATRLTKYYEKGARFAKWRAVFTIGENTPSPANISANAESLAIYAALCQKAGLVPIVEPEVLMEGDHSLRQCVEATSEVLYAVFDALVDHNVLLECIILKPNMITDGLQSAVQSDVDEVADTTIHSFKQCVPENVPGIAFLSGGQAPQLATARLNAMHVRFKDALPWRLTFSYSRAVLQPALEFWLGNERNVSGAQQRLFHRVDLNSTAVSGRYTVGMEDQLTATC